MKRSYKVLHAPSTVGGNPQGMSKALKVMGVDSCSLTFSQNYFAYKTDVVVWNKSDSSIKRQIKRLRLFFSVLRRYNILHFNAGESLFGPIFVKSFDGSTSVIAKFRYYILKSMSKALWLAQGVELFLYRLLNKPLFMTYQGSDARQGSFCRENFSIHFITEVEVGYFQEQTDLQTKRAIARFEKYCDQIYALNPDIMWVLPSSTKFIPYSHIFLDEWIPVYTQDSERPLRIAHAPSHRKIKGTDYILKALENLEKKGYDFELLLVEGLSNAEARKVYERADVLVDQLLVGWYGGLAVEAMALGKPVLVYIREEDLKFIPEQMKDDLPFVRVTPETIEQGLQKVLEMPKDELVSWARKSRAYVEKWHDPIKVANIVKADYENALKKSRL